MLLAFGYLESESNGIQLFEVSLLERPSMYVDVLPNGQCETNPKQIRRQAVALVVYSLPGGGRSTASHCLAVRGDPSFIKNCEALLTSAH